MRIWRARFVGAAMRLADGVTFGISVGMAQQGGQTGGGGAAPPATPGRGTPTPSPAPRPTTSTQPPTEQPQIPRPIWISGRVLMHDGGPPPESVTIERLCSTNSVR